MLLAKEVSKQLDVVVNVNFYQPYNVKSIVVLAVQDLTNILSICCMSIMFRST